jgi:hypothetical protein
MSEHDEIPEDVAYAEFTFKGVVHRVLVTPEEARRWIEGTKAIGLIRRGEPILDRDERLIEHHGWPEDPHVETVNPVELGVPLDPEDPEAFDHDDSDERW